MGNSKSHRKETIIDDEKTANTSFSERYCNLKSIGSGGMSIVYLGHDKLLDRQVAIKRLKVSTQGERAWLRFQQEARACATLRHPNIVSIFDFGSDEEHVPYIVLDYLRGQTLAELIEQRGTLLANEMFDIVLPVLDGLEHAHKNGVVHRDLKPGNIFLQRLEPSNQLVVKIMDFGIAKVISDRESGFETKTGEVIGSPFYISPEQLSADAIDGRADQYAIGCMIFEMLTGKPPFVGKSVLATFMMHKSDTAPLLSTRPNGRPVSAQLEKIVSKLLEKAPQDRYESITQVKDVLNSARQEWNSDRNNLEAEKQFAAGKQVKGKYAKKLRNTFQQTGPFLKTQKGMVSILILAGAVVAMCFFILAPSESDHPPTKRVQSLDPNTLTTQEDLKRVSISELSEQFKDGDNRRLILNGISNLADLIGPIAKKFPFVNHVLIEEMPVTANEIRKLAMLKKLTCLQLKEVSGATVEVLNAVATLKTLKELEIRATESQLPEHALAEIKSLPIDQLTLDLHFSERNIDDIASMFNLKYLSLNSSKLDEKWLLKLVALKRLETLHLDGVDLKGDCLEILPQLNLSKISLRANPISSKVLQKLPSIPSAGVVDFEGCLEFGDAEVKELCRIFPNMRYLSLKSTKVSDAGVRHLARLKFLAHVDLARTSVSNRMIPVLASIPQLREVELDNTKVDSNGVIDLLNRCPGIAVETTFNDDERVNQRLKELAQSKKSELRLKDPVNAVELNGFQKATVGDY